MKTFTLDSYDFSMELLDLVGRFCNVRLQGFADPNEELTVTSGILADVYSDKKCIKLSLNFRGSLQDEIFRFITIKSFVKVSDYEYKLIYNDDSYTKLVFY